MERTKSKLAYVTLHPRQLRKKNKLSLLSFLVLSLFAVLATLKLALYLDLPSCSGVVSLSRKPLRISQTNTVRKDREIEEEEEEENGFWRQPDGMGYRPCLEFSKEYAAETEVIMRDRRKYVVAAVTGGLNQQRNQIVDAVVIARILGAAFVTPLLDVNAIWRDESEFPDIYDWEHFKITLADDIRVVSALPLSGLRVIPVEIGGFLPHATPKSIRSKYLNLVNESGVVILRGFDSWLSNELPPDLQRLKCKVAFHAFKFSAPIFDLGNKLATRMQSKGPYLALHLRMEEDVWVRTGCLPGLTNEYDNIIKEERRHHPELLTGRSKMRYHERKLAGLCPLTVVEVTRLLKALGCPKDAKIYWAGGEPFGGPSALGPLVKEFPFLYSKEDIALPGELEPYKNKSSILAAIDYIVLERSDVFMPSHGGNMGRVIRGVRAYAGHRKCITPNKRRMMPHFLNSSLDESEFNEIIKELHETSIGRPRPRSPGRDVTLRPIPLCMCTRPRSTIQERLNSLQEVGYRTWDG